MNKFLNIENIENKPKLFLQIYKNWANRYDYQVRELYPPQELANLVLQDAKRGERYAQFLKMPENEILNILRNKNMSRKELANILGISVANINTCISRGKCSKSIKELIKNKIK